jgi:ethanolamine ammonia-lyase small subunit
MSDVLAKLRTLTVARVGLGRCGNAIPTAPLLAFQAAHARARHAIHDALDCEKLSAELAGLDPIVVASRVQDRREFLQRPDLGRRLRSEDGARLPHGPFDVVFVLADGLSASALQAHAPHVLRHALSALQGWRVAPVVVANQARVALGDDIAAGMGAAAVAVLIGERPGLAAADSLGVYVTWHPEIGTTDGERNCISNIHGRGMSHDEAAGRLVWLLENARAKGHTGVALKDEYRTPARSELSQRDAS